MVPCRPCMCAQIWNKNNLKKLNFSIMIRNTRKDFTYSYEVVTILRTILKAIQFKKSQTVNVEASDIRI